MIVTHRGDLRKICNTDNMVRLRKFAQGLADGLGDTPGYADVNFIEDQRW